MGIRDNKLFSVPMGEDAVCDCGAKAPTQFVIATSETKAKEAGKAARAARALGQKADVACGVCLAKKISERGFILAEIFKMKQSPIKHDRIPYEAKCVGENCGKTIPFGTFAYYSPDSGLAICQECAAKRGMTEATRAKLAVSVLEKKEDLKALKSKIKL